MGHKDKWSLPLVCVPVGEQRLHSAPNAELFSAKLKDLQAVRDKAQECRAELLKVRVDVCAFR